MLKDKTIVLGITGGIAAYKAADLASKLTQAEAKVETVMTEAATRFITPLTLRNVTGRPVVTDMWEPASEYNEEHIALAEAADAVVIAPATANTIAKLAAGIADNMLGCIVLATGAPVILAPAMNDVMYQNSVTQENLAKLKARGIKVIEPEYGRLASGKMGQGRLPDTPAIIKFIEGFVCLYECLLEYIFSIFRIFHILVCQGKNSLLIFFKQESQGLLVSFLSRLNYGYIVHYFAFSIILRSILYIKGHNFSFSLTKTQTIAF